jgi:Flp pilus assembly pilin Flp
MPHSFVTRRHLRAGRAFAADRRGVTSLEYALMASSIALFIITAVFAAGAHISSWYTTLANTNW